MNKDLSSNDIFEILQTNQYLLKKYSVKRIGLFGSYIRKEETKNSDIDFLVDFEEKSFDNFINLVFELEKIFNRKVDLQTEKSISPYMLPYIKNEVRWYEA